MKKQENIYLRKPVTDSPTLQTKFSNIKNLQEEMRSQALFKHEAETQQQTLNSWVEVVRKREYPPLLTMVEGVVQARLNKDQLR